MIDEKQYRIESSSPLLPIIDALGMKDPAAALALAKTQPDNIDSLLEAAAFQPKTAAKALLQDIFARFPGATIRSVAKASAIDPDFAKELYTKNKQSLETQSVHFTSCYREDGSSTADRVDYAYHISSIDPVEARLIIETEYANALTKPGMANRST